MVPVTYIEFPSPQKWLVELSDVFGSDVRDVQVVNLPRVFFEVLGAKLLDGRDKKNIHGFLLILEVLFLEDSVLRIDGDELFLDGVIHFNPVFYFRELYLVCEVQLPAVVAVLKPVLIDELFQIFEPAINLVLGLRSCCSEIQRLGSCLFSWKKKKKKFKLYLRIS